MKLIKKILVLFFLFPFLCIISCSDEDNTISPVVQDEFVDSHLDFSDPVLEYILDLGFSESVIVDVGNRYLVEGDIAFPKDLKVPSISNEAGRVSQYYSGTLVNIARQSSIEVRIDPSINSQTSEINSAINLWNNSGSNVHFRIITSGNHDILIRDVDLGSGVCGEAGFPLNGIPFATVSINVDEVASDSYSQRAVNIAHELGHCIGLWHTNSSGTSYTDEDGNTWSSASVPGWGGSDESSIMQGGKCHELSTQLSSKDKGAIKALYRNPKPQNTQIQITSSQFIITWDAMPNILSDSFTGFEINYGGFSGINFGGEVTLSPTTTSYTIPNVTPYPSSYGTTGGIQVTIRALFSNTTVTGSTVYRYKSGGVWQ